MTDETPRVTDREEGCTCIPGGHALLCSVHAEEAQELMAKLAHQEDNQLPDQTPRVPELWWSGIRGVLFATLSEPPRYFSVGDGGDPGRNSLPSDAVKLGDVEALREKLDLIGRLLTGWDTDDVPPATIRRIRSIVVEGENR